jgi:hypothetical protein
MGSPALEVCGPFRPAGERWPWTGLTAGARAASTRAAEIAAPAGRNGSGKAPATRAAVGNGPGARLGWLRLAVALIAALGICAACGETSSPAAGTPQASAPGSGVSTHTRSPRQPLVGICQRAPCPNAQVLEIFDQDGAPIFSVGEYGGASVIGDNLRVWAPGTDLLAGTAAVTLSWESPGEYDRQFKLAGGCTPPAIWESPQAIWACTASHEWKIALRF